MQPSHSKAHLDRVVVMLVALSKRLKLTGDAGAGAGAGAGAESWRPGNLPALMEVDHDIPI
jgi:hypothetical protein